MIEKLARDAFQTDYFRKLYIKINNLFTNKILKLYEIHLSKKELIDILRFADIFSNSRDEKLKNISYGIISLLFDTYYDNEVFNTYANAVLKKLDNFPALKNTKPVDLPLSRELEFLADKEVLRSPIDRDRFFLPNQHIIYKNLKDGKSLTFSGPTSMGKSFVIKQFILEMIATQKNNNNYCIIVPTRALIKQYVSELNNEFHKLNIKTHKIITNASILEFLDIESIKFVFILTQERLNVLLYSAYNINLNYLIIDEAYKIYDENIRGLTFYSAVNACLDKYKDIKVLFSSPLIDNPEIFKDTFVSSLGSYIDSYKSYESPVAQNLFYVDLEEKTVEKINDIDKSNNVLINNFDCNRNEFYYRIGGNDNNIVYLSGQDRAIRYSLEFLEYLKFNNINLLNDDEKQKLNELCDLIEKNIHKDFFLIQVLKEGIAYHYGKLPNIIRESIENLFKEGIIKYMFCTSTLLEGVNLPAKNIFIMANFIGNKKMKPLEFWNLAGRAGRLGYEYYGNVFCVNDHNHHKAWKKKDILYTKDSIKIKDNLENKINVEKNKIIEIISSDEPTIDLKESEKYTNYLANIIQIDTVSGNDSIIIETTNKIEPQLLDIANSTTKPLDYNWINSNKTIDYKIQQNLYNEKTNLKLITIDYYGCLKMLNYMYDHYNWGIKEERLKNKKSLEYIALLMNSWINGRPLNEIIDSSIQYYLSHKKNIDVGNRNYKRFMKDNPLHINLLINGIIKDIEQLLRFDLEKYFNHYYYMLKLKYGEDSIGYNIALYLEFGTRNTYEIILQNAGFSRYTSHILQKDYARYLKFDDNNFWGIDKTILSTNIVYNSIVYNEVNNSSYIISRN